MQRKMIALASCMLMVIAAFIPVAMTQDNTSKHIAAPTVVLETENGCGCGEKPIQANHCLWSGVGSNLVNTATTPAINLASATSCILTLWKQYDIAPPDHGDILISTDGVTWVLLKTITGLALEWEKNEIDLSAYAGMASIQLRFAYVTFSGSISNGWHIDDVKIMSGSVQFFSEDFETGATGWTLDGWTIVEKHAPPDNTITKWQQLPDINETGIDVCVDRNEGNISRTIADDFLCSSTGPITDIHLWGSWMDDIKGNVTKIHLSIHSDVPVGPNHDFSTPGDVLWQMDFYPGQFAEFLYYHGSNSPEWWWDPWTGVLLAHNHANIWEYDITVPDNRTFQQNGTEQQPIVYWLDVYFEVHGGRFGWKTARVHWNDDAVRSPPWIELFYPMGHPFANQSIDMAFRLTSSKCCFQQTWPKRKCFFLHLQIPITNICNKTFPSGTVSATWTITNTGPNNIFMYPPTPSGVVLGPGLTGTWTNWITYSSGSWAPGSQEPAKSPLLIGGKTTFDVTLQIDNCPPETHHGGWRFIWYFPFGWYGI